MCGHVLSGDGMKRSQVNLTGAESIYAVSNVPLFLLRKLQADAAPREISSSLSADQILDELRASLQVKPSTLREAVEPYVLLVALAQKQDIGALKKAATINALHHDWFAYLSSVLEQTYRPSVVSSLIIPGQLQVTVPSNTSTASTSTRRLIL